jgi:hypothetical protein
MYMMRSVHANSQSGGSPSYYLRCDESSRPCASTERQFFSSEHVSFFGHTCMYARCMPIRHVVEFEREFPPSKIEPCMVIRAVEFHAIIVWKSSVHVHVLRA